MSVLVDLLNGIKQRQNDLVESVTGIDLTKIKPVVTPIKPLEDPIEKVATKMGVSTEKLKGILRVEDDTPLIIAKERFGSSEKGAMVLIYTYQFGVNKTPTHDEVAASFGQSGFTPAFGRRAKDNLKKGRKIHVEDDKITLTGSGIADAEREVKRILGIAEE